MSLRLGLDTGGTYTDAVLIDDSSNVIAQAKALTTHTDLSNGIRTALSKLPTTEFGKVVLASISTTLATNAVVEGRGAPVGLFLIGYNSSQIERSKLHTLVHSGRIISIDGGHDAIGHESKPFDINAARNMLIQCKDKVSAIGISSQFAVRNPSHELALKKLVKKHTTLPVTCGHELASSLDAPRRAITVAINASLIPYISDLIISVTNILNEYSIQSPLMVVKGDGSLVSAEVALERPVETVMSGPAASIIGAHHLSQTADAIVADMGGTTTDIAVIANGQPRISTGKTFIGDWQPMVETIQISSLGLGGDSEVRYQGGLGVAIGPRRVIPISLLAELYPSTIAMLENQLAEPVTSRSNRFALQLHGNEMQLSQMSTIEKDVWHRLEDEPISLETFTRAFPDQARAIASLVRRGMVIYSGLTPSDAAHVLGHAKHWSYEAAVLATNIWARQMRHVYGWSAINLGDTVGAAQLINDLVISKIVSSLIRVSLTAEDAYSSISNYDSITATITNLVTNTHRSQNGLFSLSFDPHVRLVGVGAPAYLYYPEVSKILHISSVVPPHADAANAIGAVVGRIVQRQCRVITQPALGIYRIHDTSGPQDFSELEHAIKHATKVTNQEAYDAAIHAGAESIKVMSSTNIKSVDPDDLSPTVFFECTVISTATGLPMMRH
ncbi:MAG: hypothetical protein CL398_00560 [Acidiferrobacteraceae bacterium]|nr:hypothetical protein [Acidiferrobacteraceae bacterium]